MKKQWLVGMAALAMTGVAVAEGPGAARKRAEASMLITGEIMVATDGSVTGYAVDKQEKLPPQVQSLLAQATPKWRFEPVMRDGQAVAAKAHMNLRIVAKRDTPDSPDYMISIASASFGEEGAGGEQMTYAKRTPPSYPRNAAAAGVQGTVYLAIRVGRDGKVMDVAVEQVNLGVVGSDTEMKAWREALASPAVRVAKDWTFIPPTKGAHANDPDYVARVPVMYRLNRNERPGDLYGTWQPYVPGPKETVSWIQDGGSNTDALPDNGLYLVNSGLKLLTPVNKG